MNVVAYDPFLSDPAVFEADGVRRVGSVEELYKTADFLSLHIPATAETKGSIGYDLLMSMPKGATLVNTARKEVIDEEGLMRALTEREDLEVRHRHRRGQSGRVGRGVRQARLRHAQEDGRRDGRGQPQCRSGRRTADRGFLPERATPVSR